MPEKIITYFGQQAKVACDGNCKKAWGMNSRPLANGRTYEDEYDGEELDYAADDELGEAPDDPGTYEGSDAKPSNSSPNVGNSSRVSVFSLVTPFWTVRK